MKKIWNIINECLGTALAWLDKEAVAFWVAFVLAVAGFLGADHITATRLCLRRHIVSHNCSYDTGF